MQKRATALPELLAPLSAGKVMLVLELLQPDLLDQLEHCLDFIQELKLPMNSTQNALDDFLIKRYMVLEDSLESLSSNTLASTMKFFEQPKYKNIINTHAFVDGLQYKR